jgi:hypothetical protein
MKTQFTIAMFLAGASANLVAHEWGTYTSMAGSNGVATSGMHHGEESLPKFVHSRSDSYTKEMFRASQINIAPSAPVTRALLGIDPPPLASADTPFGCHFCQVLDYEPVSGTPTEVTQKLETPVVYFYSDAPVHVQLNVSFPKGIVTQVYPDTVENLPPIGQVQATANGFARWEIDVAGPGVTLDVPAVPADDIWAPSRQVEANFVRNAAGENERHVFYRGLGRFDVPVRVQSTNSSISVTNSGDQQIPAVFLFDSDGVSGGTVTPLGGVPAGRSISAPLRKYEQELASSAQYLPMDQYLKQAKQILLASLVEAGLYQLEAQAMVDTWTKSYFLSAGVRVLYVVPREWTDELLPLSMTPKPEPEDLVRVLVGRVEVLTAAAEHHLLAAVTRLTYKNYDNVQQMMEDEMLVREQGRFAEAKLTRVLQLTNDPKVHAAVRGLFAEMIY